jgi:hypothetical protein
MKFRNKIHKFKNFALNPTINLLQFFLRFNDRQEAIVGVTFRPLYLRQTSHKYKLDKKLDNSTAGLEQQRNGCLIYGQASNKKPLVIHLVA